MEYLNEEKIQSCLQGTLFTYDIEVYNTLASTNDYGKENINLLNTNARVILTEEQTGGRGRIGRQWEGSTNKDIFMSILITPELDSGKVSMITLLVALSVYKVLESRVDKSHKLWIKWPNDLILCGKKVCGILCEYIVGKHTKNNLIIGIGLNVNRTIFSKENPMASSLALLEGKEFDRNILVAELLYTFDHYYSIFLKTKDFSYLSKEYNASLFHMEKEVRLIGAEIETGYCLGINKDGMLLIKDPSTQEIKTIFCGEISLRSLEGYY